MCACVSVYRRSEGVVVVSVVVDLVGKLLKLQGERSEVEVGRPSELRDRQERELRTGLAQDLRLLARFHRAIT